MPEEQHWIAVVTADRYAGERLYAFETLTITLPPVSISVSGPAGSGSAGSGQAVSGQAASGPAPGDRVALVAAGDVSVLFGLGRVRRIEAGDLTLRYTHRLFDEPRVVDDLLTATLGLTVPGVRPLSRAAYERLVGIVGGIVDGGERPARQSWFVSVALPIEAPSRAEAVREFWTYVRKLGPQELPAYVWPRGDELAMQAFLLGEETNLDPEEDD